MKLHLLEVKSNCFDTWYTYYFYINDSHAVITILLNYFSLSHVFYLYVLQNDSVLLLFFHYLVLYCTGSYFHLVLSCFCLNFILVVDYCYDIILHRVFLGNPFLNWEGTCPIQTV